MRNVIQQKYNNYFNFPLNFVIEIVRICIMKNIPGSKSNKCKSEQNNSDRKSGRTRHRKVQNVSRVVWLLHLCIFTNLTVPKSQPSVIIIYLAVPVLPCSTLCPLRYLVRHRKRMNKQNSPRSDFSSSSLVRDYSFVFLMKQADTCKPFHSKYRFIPTLANNAATDEMPP